MAQRRPIFRDSVTGQNTELGVPIDDTTPSHNGELLIWDSMAQAYIPGDPLVQGVYAEGTTTIPNPVIVGGKDYSGTPALQTLKVDSSGQVYIGNFPATQPVSGTVAVSSVGGTVTVSGSVSITGTPTVDVTDRAARLLGVVYGSQGQQLKQTATDFNLATELYAAGTAYDARQIRALTSSDQITIANASIAVTGTVAATQSGTWNIGTLTSITNAVTVTGTVAATQSGNWTSRVVGNAGGVFDGTAGAAVPASILQVGGKDGNGNLFAIPLATGGVSVVVSGTVASSGITQVSATSVANTAGNPIYVAPGTSTVWAASQSGNWTARIVGNGGATLDAPIGAGTAPTNMQPVGGQYRSTLQTLSNLQTSAIALDAKAQIYTDLNYVAGSAISVSTTGVQKVGIVGGTGGATIDGVIGAATAPTNMVAVGGVYNSTLPTLATGQSAAIQVDAKGQQLTDINYLAGSPIATAATGIMKIGACDGAGTALTSTSGALDVNIKSSVLTDPAEVAQGTVAPTKVVVIGGKSNDGTPQYRELPLGLGARSVIIEGYACLTYSGSIGASVTSVKASAGQLYGMHLFNGSSATAYVQLFDAATGSVTLGTTAPKLSIGIPAGQSINVMNPVGSAFTTAISFACTTTRTGNVAPSSTIDVNFMYL